MGFFSKQGNGGATVSESLPYEDLYEDGLILTKDWGLMKVWYITYPDASLSTDVADEISERIARLFHGHPESIKETKVTYWFVTGRIPMTLVVNPSRSGLVNMTKTDYEIEKYRDDIFADAAMNDVNISYACCKVQVKLDANGITPQTRRKAEQLFTSFETALGTIGARALPCTCDDSNEDQNIMVFLKYMTGIDYANYKCPPQGMHNVSQFLSTNFLTKGQPMKLGDYYIQMLTVNAFPGVTYPNILVGIEQLPFCFKWVTRWTPMSNWDSQEAAKNLRKDYRAGAKSFKTAAYEAGTGQDSGNYEFQALTDIQEMEEVLVDLTHGETMGEMTSVILLYSKVIEDLPKMVQEVRKVITSQGFDVIVEDKTSNFPAWKSSIPGDSVSNRRKPLVTASNISHIVPFTSMYHGSITNKHLARISGVNWPHAIGRLSTNELYYLNLNGPTDDVGHTFIVGSTGGGKSVLLAFLASQWMRYPNSRVILFDKDMSFERLCRSTDGAIYVPSAENSDLTFMPLSRINTRPDQAADWIYSVVESSGVSVTPEMKEKVMYVCEHWDSSIPTVKRFVENLKGYDPTNQALPSLQALLNNDSMAKLFGSERDTFNASSFKRKTMIEMGPLMNMGDYAVLPTLQFLFDRMDELFDSDPQPTLLIMDEAWKFLTHKVFRAKIKEWLKTLRKKNVFVMFAIQNLNDIDDAEEFLTSCHTRIYLPNSALRGEGAVAVKDLYRKMGVTDYEIEIIGNAERKRHYYIQQEEGSALVDFCIDSFHLARIAKRGD